MSILCKLFQTVEEERRFPNSFYKASITLILKPDKGSTRKDNYRPLSLINTDVKNPQQNTNKPNSTAH